MSEYDSHDIRAKLSKAYDPIFRLMKRLTTLAEEVLTEFRPDGIDKDIISTFIADLSDLEGLYDEFLTMVEEITQDLEYESRAAKEILTSFRSLRELFSDIRIQAENLLGFAKPGLENAQPLIEDLIRQLNDMIRRLRIALSEEIKPKIQKLMDEQSRVEHLFMDERTFEQ